jgi:hypothetical protein
MAMGMTNADEYQYPWQYFKPLVTEKGSITTSMTASQQQCQHRYNKNIHC